MVKIETEMDNPEPLRVIRLRNTGAPTSKKISLYRIEHVYITLVHNLDPFAREHEYFRPPASYFSGAAIVAFPYEDPLWHELAPDKKRIAGRTQSEVYASMMQEMQRLYTKRTPSIIITDQSQTEISQIIQADIQDALEPGTDNHSASLAATAVPPTSTGGSSSSSSTSAALAPISSSPGTRASDLTALLLEKDANYHESEDEDFMPTGDDEHTGASDFSSDEENEQQQEEVPAPPISKSAEDLRSMIVGPYDLPSEDSQDEDFVPSPQSEPHFDDDDDDDNEQPED